ncbi:hypothetical protein SOVF_198080 [Spinacia oleracea]|uniref:Albumin-2 n=1 Tax=Spinacia oleracea TaxID=3562 RepID=A0A9R0IUF0_SPIOL|nr:albumin-2-like [Spinacia oleracea]KNA04611.1 hypothetical protein SOVF_198080 [Spinacia oleracea]
MSNNSYVTAAFKSTHKNQVYLFMYPEYVLDDYAPGTATDTILYGPAYMRDVFSSLKDTVFSRGIDSAFESQDPGDAYIFIGVHCAKWFYAPDSTNDKILKGPMYVSDMFPFLKGTEFENGVFAAFNSTIPYEAYLFSWGNQYARINYSDNGHLITLGTITQGFPCLKGTIFEKGIDACFASHIPNQVYLFKHDSYALIQYTPGTTSNQTLINSGKIIDKWPQFGSLLPRDNANHLKLVTN